MPHRCHFLVCCAAWVLATGIVGKVTAAETQGETGRDCVCAGAELNFCCEQPGGPQQAAETQQERAKEADRIAREMIELTRAGKFNEAIIPAQKAANIRKEVWGENDIRYSDSLRDLADLYNVLGNYASAEPFYRQSLKIYRTAQIKNKGYVSLVQNYMAMFDRQATQHVDNQEYSAARKVRQDLLNLVAEEYAERHWRATDARLDLAHVDRLAEMTPAQHEQLSKASELSSQAATLGEEGRYSEAVSLQLRAAETCQELLGQEHPYTLACLNNLAVFYKDMGDYAKAEPQYQRVLKLREQSLGKLHPHFALSLNNLAALYRAKGDNQKAEESYREALTLRQQLLGENDPLYAQSLSNLASLYREMKEYQKAEPLFANALEIYRRTLGKQHPEYATCVNNVAVLYECLGDLNRAESSYNEVLQIFGSASRNRHPHYARTLVNLGTLHWSNGDKLQAERLIQQALEIALGNLELAALAQSERQQLATLKQLRDFLDVYLSLSAEIPGSTDIAYNHLLTWKGSVFFRQRQLRRDIEPEFAEQFRELETVGRQLANLVASNPAQPASQSRTLEALFEKKERIETELARSTTIR